MINFQSDRTLVMGIINATDDSFSGDGIGSSVDKAVQQAIHMEKDGADIIDIGGESTRRFCVYYDVDEPVISAEEEITKIIPMIEAIKTHTSLPISVDTYKAQVAQAALEAGASIINDVKGGSDGEMFAIAAEYKVPVIIMHMKDMGGQILESRDKYQDKHESLYDDVLAEVRGYLERQVSLAQAAGVSDIIVDPGIGFGKTTQDSLSLLRNLSEFADLGTLMVGTSRKSFIGHINGNISSEDRLPGTLGSIAAAVMNGVKIVRVHDVREARQCVDVVDAIMRA